MRTTRRVGLAAAAGIVGGGVAMVAGLAGAPGQAASAAAPVNTAPPVISGEPEVDRTLTATTGSWSGTEPIVFTYAWQRCDSTGGNCVVVPGSTFPTYPLERQDERFTIRVQVTAANAQGSASATSV